MRHYCSQPGYRYDLLEFDGTVDLYRYLQNKQTVPGRPEEALNSGGNAFINQGTATFEEAMNKLLYGDEELNELLQRIKVDKLFAMVYKNKTRYRDDVYGFAPNVANFVMNLPRSMVNAYKTEKKKRSLRLFVETNWVIPGKADFDPINSNVGMITRGVCVLAMINWLESRGTRCEVYWTQIFKHREKYKKAVVNAAALVTTVNLKRAGEPLNPSKLVVPFMHPSFTRRLMFRVQEVTKSIPNFANFSYGTALADIPDYNYTKISRDEKKLKRELDDKSERRISPYLESFTKGLQTSSDFDDYDLPGYVVDYIDRSAPLFLLQRYPGVYIPSNFAVDINPHYDLKTNIRHLIEYVEGCLAD